MTDKRTKWYAETKGFHGKWQPCFYYGDKPSTKVGESTRELNNVTEIVEELAELSLGEVFEHVNGLGPQEVKCHSCGRTQKTDA